MGRMGDALRRRQQRLQDDNRDSGTGGVSDIDSDRAVINEEHMRRRIGQDKPSETNDAALSGLSSRWRNYVIRFLHMVDDWGLLPDHLLGTSCSYDHGGLRPSQVLC